MFHFYFSILSFAALQLKTRLLSPSWTLAAYLPPASSWSPHSSAPLDQAVVQFFDDLRHERDSNMLMDKCVAVCEVIFI